MIQNISMNVFKLINNNKLSAFAKKRLFSQIEPSLASFYICKQLKYNFSTQKQAQKKTQGKQKSQKKRQRQSNNSDYSAIDYYRNTIRRVNIRSNGRGKFSPYMLSKIINMSKTQQHAKIMFQAYFNYLGHFTLIPNSIVDDLVIKATVIKNQIPHLMEIFTHHNYLTYFPHYDATNRFLKHLISQGDSENLLKLVKTLIRSPLIKINHKTVENLSEQFNAENVEAELKQAVLKLFIYRNKLVDGVNHQDMTAKVSTLLTNSEAGPFEAKPRIIQALNSLLQQNFISNENTAQRLIIASTFSMIQQSAEILAKSDSQIGIQYQPYFNYLQSLYQRSSQQVNYGSILKQKLGQVKLSEKNQSKLNQIQGGSSAQ